MTITTEILERRFKEFSDFIQTNGKEAFKSFGTCKYFDKEEKYKEEIYKDARQTITNGKWKQDDIGTGKIHQTINDAIKSTVTYSYSSYDNNLINHWTLKDDFSNFKPSKEFEQ